MPVELTFNARNVSELNEQILAYAKAITVSWTAPAQTGHRTFPPPPFINNPEPDDAKYRSPLVEPAPLAGVFPNGDTVADVDTGDNSKPRRKHRRTKDLPVEDIKSPDINTSMSPEPQPEPLAEPQVDVVQNAPDDTDLHNVNAGAPETTSTLTLDTVANEKLKNQVIAQLQDLFAAGKVRQIRGVLDKYGRGAKSFPEVDAVHFREIGDAIRSGEFA